MLKKYFVFETELFSKISVWKNLKFSQQFIKLWKKSPEGVLYEKVFLEISRGLQFFKKEILAQNFLRIPFLQNTSGGCFFFPHNHKLLTEFNFIRFWRHFDIKKY